MPASRLPKKFLCSSTRFCIISLRLEQRSWRQIVQETGEKESPVRNVVNHFLEHGTYEDLSKSGQTRKIDDRGLRHLGQAVLKDPTAMIQDLARKVTLDSGKSAVERALKELRFGVFELNGSFG
ncbi:hypothetical protein HOY80DRAFT_1098082 [Tuber brumale]|nr:hypothetical protein HOY80DRAFT_1098082 [Tuber brumale]